MIKRIRNWVNGISEWPIIHQFLDWSKKSSIPGFAKVSIYDVVKFIIIESQRDAITTRASSIAFNLFLAIFPAIIFIFTLIPLLPFSGYYTNIIEQSLQNALPPSASNYLLEIIAGITDIKREGLLSFGFILSAFFSSNGMLNLMSGFDKSYDLTFKKRGYFKRRWLALLLTFLLIVFFAVSVLFIVAGDVLLEYILVFLKVNNGEFLFDSLRILLAIIFIYSGISIIYRYGPSMYRRIAFINPGAVLATTLSILTSVAFSFFIQNFGRYNEIYGSIGALIIIMIWLQLNSFILLIGFELNASIAVNRDLSTLRE